MTSRGLPAESAERIAATLRRVSPDYAPTPLVDLPRLAAGLGVAQVLVKDEGRRALGSFKSLGGGYAALRALARAAGTDVPGVLAARAGALPGGPLPDLVCASDGNHGLAVAYAARLTGARARVFLHAGVSKVRSRRIAAQGAEIVTVAGTYDDAVAAARAAADAGDAVLVADTGDDPEDAVVRDVMAGYGVLAAEVRDELAVGRMARPTHIFVQAGVGGLAAAMAEGLAAELAAPARIVVVEPAAAACVGAALATGKQVQLDGPLETAAAMLSCGRASAPALAVFQRYPVSAMRVEEVEMLAAPRRLADAGGPVATPSGAAGLAGLATALGRERTALSLGLDGESRVLLVVSEGDPGAQAT